MVTVQGTERDSRSLVRGQQQMTLRVRPTTLEPEVFVLSLLGDTAAPIDPKVTCEGRRRPALTLVLGTWLILSGAGGRSLEAMSHFPSGAGDSTLRRIVDSARCANCRLETKHVVTISDDQYPIRSRGSRFVARDSRGRLLVAGADGGVGIFDSLGRFSRSLGRRGDGPGEYRHVVSVGFGPGDSVFVWDRVHRRITVYGPSLGPPSRTIPLGAYTSYLPTSSGAVVSGAVTVNARESYALHRLDRTGRVVVSAGEMSDLTSPVFQRKLYRRLVAGGGLVLASPIGRYDIEVWTDSLKLREVLTRRVPWFPVLADSIVVVPPDVRPMPAQLMGLSFNASSGIVLVCIQSGRKAPGLRYRPIQAAGEEHSSGLPEATAEDRFLESRIEAIDINRRALVATRTLPGKLTVVVDANPTSGRALFFRSQPTTDGGESIGIVSVQLRR
jgi:hypothetical protein